MKRWMILLMALCLGTLSCEKELTDGDGAYCVNIIQNSPASTALPTSEMETIKSLFNRNRLDYTKYLFDRFQKDELGHHHVRGRQFANHLPVFRSDVIFHFDAADAYYFLSGQLVSDIHLNTKSRMTHDEVVEKFIDAARQDEYLSMQDISLEDKIDYCFDIEFGYYDLNAGFPPAVENYTKAWKIQFAAGYPYAYVNDENAEIIYYFNGIIIN
jgi:hypothetical protein